MKRHFILMLMAALLVSGTTLAQHQRRGNNRNIDPKERAERMTERMAKSYNLNDKQKKQLLEINLKQAEEQKKEFEKQREQGKQKREQMMKKRKAKREAYDAKLQKILTKEQYESYKKDLKKRNGKGPKGPRGERQVRR